MATQPSNRLFVVAATSFGILTIAKIKWLMFCRSFLLFITLLASTFLFAQKAEYKPKVLVVTAHPDDETGMAATIYKITHELEGTVDQCVITNGEGGYKYSTLGEAVYGLELTDEAVGRANLPRIRKQELMSAGEVIGTHNLFFLDQKDAHYGLNEKEPLDTTWNVDWVTTRLKEIMTQTRYDFVFCLLPVPETHAHHKAATLLTLRVVKSLPEAQRPVVLGVTSGVKNDTAAPLVFTQLNDYKESSVKEGKWSYTLDRTTPFGYKNKLNYQIVVNWEIAEHKSQGTMQLAMNRGDYENYWFFSQNDPAGRAKCKQLFDRLKEVPYESKQY